ncbi:MAG: hypothetical protein KYX62_16985 [Pseudomonadota bacterium]|nr:hypothetical protein [Pseudomonadota bacterium]
MQRAPEKNNEGGIVVKLSGWLCCLVMLTGCSSELESVSDKDLRRRHYECQHAVNLTAAEIQVCHNIRRECERRAAAGNFVC